MTTPRSIPFMAVCARLGDPTDDGLVLIPTRENQAILEGTKGLPVYTYSLGGRLSDIGVVDRIEVLWGSVHAYGRIWKYTMGMTSVMMLCDGDIHLNPSIGMSDLDENSSGVRHAWSYPLVSLMCVGRSAWSDMPRVRIGR